MKNKQQYQKPASEQMILSKPLCDEIGVGSGGDPGMALSPGRRTPSYDPEY